MDKSLEEQLIKIERLLTYEERRGLVEELADLRVRQEGLVPIERLLFSASDELETRREYYLAELGQQLDDYRKRWQYLSMLSHEEDIIWAQQILQFPNLRIVVIDQDKIEGDIIRFLAIDVTGKTRFDRFIKPSVPLNAQTSYVTG